MQELYFQYDENGNVITVTLLPPGDGVEYTAIPIDDPRYAAWYNTLQPWVQEGWPTPVVDS